MTVLKCPQDMHGDKYGLQKRNFLGVGSRASRKNNVWTPSVWPVVSR
jgi:hypothetical protein